MIQRKGFKSGMRGGEPFKTSYQGLKNKFRAFKKWGIDVVEVPTMVEAAMEILRGVDVLVLNALWFGRPHASHFNIEEAIEASRAVGARRTYLTHLTHRVVHAEAEALLPPDVRLAYDGLVVEI